jgi:hypothetical protein
VKFFVLKQSVRSTNIKYLDPRKFSRFTIDNGNIVWGKNWDLIFPVENLYASRI